MASYRNPYNEAIARKQRMLDVANLRNDYQQAQMQPLHGGGLSGGDFWSDFSDGFMSVWNPIIDTAGKVAPFLPLLGLGEGEDGYGLSGGDMSVNAPYEGYVYGSGYSGGNIANKGIPPFNRITNAGMSGGDEISDTDHPIIRNPELQATMFLGGRKPSTVSKKEKIGMVQQVISDMLMQNKLKKGMGLSGGDFWSDLGDTFSKVAPFLPLLGLGKKQALEKKYADMLLKKQLKNLHGKGLSGGDFDWSSLLSFAPLLLGLGMSGGNKYELQELQPFVTGLGMSGGDFWDDLGKGFSDAWSWVTDTAVPWVADNAKKIGDVVDTGSKIAKAVGGGVSGGDFGNDLMGVLSNGNWGKDGAGVSGGAMTYEQNMNMADAMGDIFSGMGVSGGNRANNTRVNSGAIQLYKGGGTSVNQPYLGYGVSGGKKKQGKQSKMNERLALKIAHLQGKGMEPIEDMEASNKIVGLMAKTNPEVDRKIGSGVSGGKKTSKWIDHVKAYAKQHNIKYGEALKQAKATYRG
jgi:hypothetical protein